MKGSNEFQLPQDAGKEVKMYGDVINLEYGKAKQRVYLEEADAYKLLRALETEDEEEGEEELEDPKGGFLDLLHWIFQPKGSAEV